VERGKAGISAVLLKNLIRRFRINPLWLCEGEGEMFIDKVDGVTSGYQTSSPVLKSNHIYKSTGSESSSESVEQVKQLEQHQDNLENLKSIIEFLKKEE
jgi:hypothetical protein